MNEPRLSFTPMLILSAIVIAIMLALSRWAWIELPGDVRIPIHWNFRGEVDGYAGKPMGLLFMPLMALVLCLAFAFAPRIEPRCQNFARSRKAYRMVWGSVLAMILALHASMILSILGFGVDVISVLLVMLGAQFIILGNYLGKTRSNFILGVRTRWTLSSELSWNKTHRLGGKLFMLLGLFVALGPWLSSRNGLWAIVLLGGVLVIGVFLTVYSWYIFKKDPAAPRD
ncbi:MAG: SdpI family protein [Pseudohongiellaceae bacterium]